MKKITVYVSTGYVGSKKKTVIEVEDGLTDRDLEEIARDVMFEMIEWGWEDAPEDAEID